MKLRALALALALTSFAPIASSQERDPATCSAAVHAWAARCSARGARVEAFLCPADALVIVDAAGLPVELTRDPRRGFRRAGAWGLSPIGNFADWNTVAPRLKTALDQVVACAEASPLAAIGNTTGLESPRQRGAGHPYASLPTWRERVPWLLLGALACGLLARGPSLRARPSPLRRRAWLTALAVGAASLPLRALVSPAAFFHQNGHGPSWIAHTISGKYHAYGTGFREVFGTAVSLAPTNPERAVFALQSLLGAAAVACAWVIARAVGAPRTLALAASFAVAIDPVLARGSRSESHYAAQTSLLFLAAAILARAVGPVRARGFALACAAAGLVIAEAMRMHPVGWVAAALVPAVMLLGPGSLRRRALRTAAGFALAGAVSALFALPTIRTVMTSQLGGQWAPRHLGAVLSAGLRGALPALLVVGAAAFAVVSARGRSAFKRMVPRGVVAVAVCAAMAAADVLPPGGVPAWVSGAYARLYAPTLFAAVVSLAAMALTTRARALAASAAVALGALMFTVTRGPALTHLPTDALEQRAAVAWRATLPAGARVVYLERAGDHIVQLPIYAGLTPGNVRAMPRRASDDSQSFGNFGPVTYWYRSSACATREGAAYCDAMERSAPMTPVWTRSLPASPSLQYLPYTTDPVRVGLYRVTAR